jgi:hypothetical protein
MNLIFIYIMFQSTRAKATSTCTALAEGRAVRSTRIARATPATGQSQQKYCSCYIRSIGHYLSFRQG